jgi:hypothetical protein
MLPRALKSCDGLASACNATVHITPAQEQHAITIGRGRGRVSFGQLYGRSTLEIDPIDVLLDTGSQVGGIRRGLVRVLEIPAANEQHSIMPRHKGEIRHVLAVVL